MGNGLLTGVTYSLVHNVCVFERINPSLPTKLYPVSAVDVTHGIKYLGVPGKKANVGSLQVAHSSSL